MWTKSGGSAWGVVLTALLVGLLTCLFCRRILEGILYGDAYSFVIGTIAAILTLAEQRRQKLLLVSLSTGVLIGAMILLASAIRAVKFVQWPPASVAVTDTHIKWLNENLVSRCCEQGDLCDIQHFTIAGDCKAVLNAHPPFRVSFKVKTHTHASLLFSIALAPAVWQPGKGDGVQFDIYIDDGHARRNVFSRYIDPKNIPADRGWHDYEVDLSAWAGQTVTITFATGCGPNDNCDYDWAGWGEPRIVLPIAYNFLDHFPVAEQVTQGLGEVRIVTQTIDYEPRPLLFQHPSSQVAYSLTLPLRSTLYFGYGMAPEVWSPGKGDGVEYNIYVQRPEEPYTLYRVFHHYIDPKNNLEDRRWFDERVDLSRFGGQTVKIIFEALPGPAGNANYDWGGWSAPVLVDETLPGENIAGPTASSQNVP